MVWDLLRTIIGPHFEAALLTLEVAAPWAKLGLAGAPAPNGLIPEESGRCELHLKAVSLHQIKRHSLKIRFRQET